MPDVQNESFMGNLELKNRTAWTSVTIHTQTWSLEILPMQTEPWELGLELARPYSSKSRGNLVRQIKYKRFCGDILTNTTPLGGGCIDSHNRPQQVAAQDINESGSILGRVIGKVNRHSLIALFK